MSSFYNCLRSYTSAETSRPSNLGPVLNSLSLIRKEDHFSKVMASNIDMSLNDIVLLKKKGKFGNKPLGKGQAAEGGAVSQNYVTKAARAEDLRKVIAQKQKAGMSDLRTKLKPKALYTSKYVSKHNVTVSQPNMPQKPAGFETKNFGKSSQFHLKADASGAQPKSKALSRRSDPGPLSSRKLNAPPKLPSYEEAKKITVTVPGTHRSTSSSEVRRSISCCE